jgi:hypothetical protein
MPADVSLGELWRGQIELGRQVGDVRGELRDVAAKLESLPDRVAAGAGAHVDGYRREHAAQHEADDLKHSQLSASVATLWRIVWSVIGTVFVTVGAAVLSLVIAVQGTR